MTGEDHDPDEGLAERVESLERTVRDLLDTVGRLRDTAEIQRLLASYGPAVDSNSAELAAELWTEDGVYDVDGWQMRGRGEIREMLGSEVHQPYVRTGSAHQVSLPAIEVRGDTAEAVSFMSLIQRDGETFVIRRQTANLWQLGRGPDGWRVTRRSNRLLDGSPAARDLLRDGLVAARAGLGGYAPSPRDHVRDQVALYEESGGRDGNTMHGLPVVILWTRGRRSGATRKTPLMRVEHEGRYAVVASMGGAPTNPLWYHNLLDQPLVHLQDGPRARPFHSRVLTGSERDLWWDRSVAAFPPYAEYRTRTDREIPVVLLTPAQG